MLINALNLLTLGKVISEIGLIPGAVTLPFSSFQTLPNPINRLAPEGEKGFNYFISFLP